jgi:hypothetical protein
MFKPIQKEIKMPTNRFFNLILAAVVVVIVTLAIQQIISTKAIMPETAGVYAESKEQALREFQLGERYGETPSHVAEFSAEQIHREYFLRERYGVTPQSELQTQILREYWLGERYGQRLGQAMQVRNALDSGTRSYIAWGKALERAKLNALDSGTRSYIAWGDALQAAGKLDVSGTCPNTTQENVFAGIDNNLDSATRSYIAWGLALQAKDDTRACR